MSAGLVNLAGILAHWGMGRVDQKEWAKVDLIIEGKYQRFDKDVSLLPTKV
ncbi:MAG: hypothetical protein GWN93_02565 [Deltaproteobacteria bacterium]|nr:hypothetical protein [Deltaproteobacteria bacterium]